MDLSKYSYYAQPEGKDAFGKIVDLNKYAVVVGLGWSTIDVLMVTKPKGYLPMVARYAFNTAPLMGMATAFCLGTYVSTNVRGKDDRLNYVIGGALAGSVYGAWRGSVVSGGVAALFLGIAAAVKKLSIEEGWEFFPKPKTQGRGSLRGVIHDYTWMADRPGNWSRGEQ